MLPLGVSAQDSRTKLVPIQPSMINHAILCWFFDISLFVQGGALKHHILSVSSATSNEEIIDSNVLGFIVVYVSTYILF
jgi:hypothetical protein